MRIRRVIILALLFTLGATIASGQSRHALLIGIGDYPSDSGWNRIHGNNDVEIIRSSLLRQGFPENQISVLIDSSATKKNILASFMALTSHVRPGDIAYIHFSGHGQQVTDLDGDEEDGFDEAWIPYDAKKVYEAGVYEGQNHLIDDELNTLLSKLRVRIGSKGKIIVVADACHSGSGSRGNDEDIFIRGTRDKFILPGKPQNVKRKSEPTDWLFIAACKPYQSNYEYRSPDGKYYGVLSYVIANDGKSFDRCKYQDILFEWSESVANKIRYPQNLDNEGQPSRKNVYLF